MTSALPTAAIICVFAMASQPEAEGATRFVLKPISIADGTNVDATAINISGAVVGSYMNASGNPSGFILADGVLTILPPTYQPCIDPQFCAAHPTAINEAGSVVGWTYPGYPQGFLWQDGAYVAAGAFAMGEGGEGANGPGLNKKGMEFFNFQEGSGQSVPYAGLPSNIGPIAGPGGPNSFPILDSMNDRGKLAGQFYATIRGSASVAVFAGRPGKYSTLVPPRATGSLGGFVNDYGQVAGSYQDTKAAWHGFVHSAGKYVSFDMPEAAASITVQGITNGGRVVGVYTSANTTMQNVFLYNGSGVAVLGPYPATDFLQIAINNRGVMVLADSATTGTASYRVYCHGEGC
jgi:probable HAF family extracellular repeat protein